MKTPNFTLEKDVFFALCLHCNTPVSLGLWLRFKYSEFTQLTEKEVNPRDYKDKFLFRKDYLVCEYLSKFSSFPSGNDPKRAALQTFNKAEESCRMTNHRLDYHRPGQTPGRVSSVIQLATRKIDNLLGEYSHKWLELCKWGPGVTQSLSGSVTLPDKLCEKQISITEQALPYARYVMGCDLHWLQARGINAQGPVSLLRSEFQFVEGCRYTTVPKNAKTDRSIAIEPTLNQFLQGGIGIFIRSRLRRVGVDLNRQEINQRRASVAYEKSLATVDLSAASDSISKSLIWTLLPLPWATALDNVRSRSICIDGEWNHLHKFSAMGNGFTFELESLIFWALAQACCDLEEVTDRATVYGDDIILDSRVVPLLREVFDYLGFTINMKKSHYDSLFRESCGKHFFDNIDVSPIYLRRPLNNLNRIILAHNQLMRLAQQWASYRYFDSIFRPAIMRLAQAGNDLRDKLGIRSSLQIPLYSESDTGFLTCSSKIGAIPPHGARLRVWYPVVRKRVLRASAMLAYWHRFCRSNYLEVGSSYSSVIETHVKSGSNFIMIEGSYDPLYQTEISKQQSIRSNPRYRLRKQRFSTWEGGEVLWI